MPFVGAALRDAEASGSQNSRALQSFLEDQIPLGSPGGQLRAARGMYASGDAKDLHSRTNGMFASPGPSRKSPDCERRRLSGVFTHGFPERRLRHDHVRCGRIHSGALPGNGRRSPQGSQSRTDPTRQSGLLIASFSGNAHRHSSNVRTWGIQLVQVPRIGSAEGSWPVRPAASSELQIC